MQPPSPEPDYEFDAAVAYEKLVSSKKKDLLLHDVYQAKFVASLDALLEKKPQRGIALIQRLIRQASTAKTIKVAELLFRKSVTLKDNMTQRIVSRSVIVRHSLPTLSLLTAIRANEEVDLSDPATIKAKHIRCLKEMIQHMGMHDIADDLIHRKNLLYLANINADLRAALESHMLKKARRYKNFWNLLRYIDSEPKADKKKFFIEIFKHRQYYGAKIAMERMKKHPELHKFYTMS